MHLIRPTLLASMLLSTAALAVVDVDVFLDSKRNLPVPGPLSEATAKKVARGRISNTEPRLGVPTIFWADRHSDAPDLRALGVTPIQAARRALVDYAGLYRTSPSNLLEASLLGVHDLGTGAVIAQFEHKVNGLKVFNERLNVLMSQRLELVALTGSLSSLPWRNRGFKLTAPTALAVAFEGAFGVKVDGGRFAPRGFDAASGLRFEAASIESHHVSLARAMQVLFPDVDGGELVSAWYVELEASPRTSASSELIGTVVSALDGRVLWRHSLTASEAYTYRVWADPTTKRPEDGPNGISTPHPTGLVDGTSLPFVAPRLVTLENAGLSTNDPWLPPGAGQTTGNNTETYADLVTPDGFGTGDLRGTPTGPSLFGDTYDVALASDASAAQRNAGIAQLFYTVNWLHDWLYDKGFNEQAGNAQLSNFGRGGAEGDPINTEAQDSSGFNNANMSTPADGARPRMQMYVWQVAGSSRVEAPTVPLDVAGVSAVFGPSAFDLTLPAVLGADGTAPTGDGCQPLVGSYTGRIAIIDRGTCSFKIKVANAQLAGAAGVILVNTAAAAPGALADDATVTTVITIPTQLILLADGNTLKAAVAAGPVSVRLRRSTPPTRDGSIDNSVVAHEWGHYLSNRLVPGLGTQQARGMGEGWSDFVALLMTTEEADALRPANPNFSGAYTLAVWDADSTAVVTNATYFGIRRTPYSVDFAKNALTFKHIADGAVLPTAAPILNFPPNSAVHNTGEVWATMLWECYVSLLRSSPRLTFAQARDRMERYLVAGLKLTPGRPTFTEARDGVLAAAAATDLVDFRLFAQAFARRGAGITAVAPAREVTTNSPVVEDFGTGNDVAFVEATLDDEGFYCDRDGLLDVGETGHLRVTLKNTGFDALTGLTATVSSPLAGVVATPSTLTFAAIDPFTTGSATADIRLPAGLTAPTALVLNIEFTATGLAVPGPRSQSVTFTVNKDSVANQSASDNVEADAVAWRFTADGGSPSERFERVAVDALSHRFLGPDTDGETDISLESPPLVVGTAPASFTFSNRWSLELDTSTTPATPYDGAVIELTTDDGLTWTDLGAQVTPAYNFTLDPAGGNALAGRQVFSGRSAGYPAFVTTTVNLGTTYAGQTVRVRLRIGTDQAVGDLGWDIDDFVFTGLTNTPFPTAVADRALCINRPPVANAGPDLTVDERAQVTLSAAASTDPDNNTLVATWTQLDGPPVTLTQGQFTAPEVQADATLRFSLSVNDGTVNSTDTDTVEVLVRQVNRVPVVSAGADLEVDERSNFALPGVASDADGETLTLAWRQVSGPTAQVTGAASLSLAGVAPEVTANAELEFELSANDGAAAITDTVKVTVRQVNRAPTTTATTPQPAVAIGTQVALVGTVEDLDGDATTLQWSQTAGPTVELSTPTAATSGFTAPVSARDVTFSFSLVASDGMAMGAPATVSVLVTGNGGRLTANAGGDITVPSGESAQLDGSGSSDPTGSALTYAWTQENAGSRLTFSGENTAKPTVTAPVVTANERLAVRLTVTNAAGETATAFALVTVEAKRGSCGCTEVGGLGPMVFAAALMLLRRRRNG